MGAFEWILAVALIGGGSYWFWPEEETADPTPIAHVEDASLMSETPIFERGRYYRSAEGYLISNLTPEAGQFDGCERSVLTADLTATREGGAIEVQEVAVGCEG